MQLYLFLAFSTIKLCYSLYKSAITSLQIALPSFIFYMCLKAFGEDRVLEFFISACLLCVFQRIVQVRSYTTLVCEV
ncbi:hypothetical protein CQA63_06350 [Helicobacter marmotae]|uniref:Uncharacterized protein n=1 Tax=Helicobacter marmotae TaxID=152490 RepID=A0A3D8I303_9HELI|nr:hypothetical protein CQA63_06350 [Helicobacter marmotae]